MTTSIQLPIQLPILTDRSRIESHKSCNRKRFYAYHYNGIGLQSTKLSLPLTVGLAFHEGMEYLLSCYKGVSNGQPPLTETVDAAIIKAQQWYDEKVQARSLDVDYISSSFAYQENRALIEVLIRVYAKIGLVDLLGEFDVLEVEKEIDVPLLSNKIGKKKCSQCTDGQRRELYSKSIIACPTCEGTGLVDDDDCKTIELILMSRPDAILRHKLSGEIFVLSFKTASEYYSATERRNRWDNQSISELIGIEYWLQQDYGESYAMDVQEGANLGKYNPPKVSGIRMEYICKGRHVKAEKYHEGMNIQPKTKYYDNPILHPYKDQKDVSGESYEPTWNYEKFDGSKGTLGKGWQRVNAWEQGETFIKDWIDYLMEKDQRCLRLLQQMVVQPVTFTRNENEVERWKRQTIAQELRIADGLNTLTEEVMDSIFSLNPASCVEYTSTCPFADICWNGVEPSMKVQFDELMEREPNHTYEKEMLGKG